MSEAQFHIKGIPVWLARFEDTRMPCRSAWMADGPRFLMRTWDKWGYAPLIREWDATGKLIYDRDAGIDLRPNTSSSVRAAPAGE